MPEDRREAPPGAVDEWDAGHMGCGELLIALRKRLRDMPGETLKVVALDPAAPLDLPAWCRITGNALLHHEAGTRSFWIRSKAEWR